MEERLSRWGIGPRITWGAIAYAAVVAAASYFRPDVCIIHSLSYAVFLVAGVVLLVAGIPLWIAGVVAAMTAYHNDALVTSGAFRLVRHPVYAAWIVFLFPAIALLCRSWPLLGTSLVAYGIFKLSIKREDEYLEQRFGQAYREYRARVNEIIPFPFRLD